MKRTRMIAAVLVCAAVVSTRARAEVPIVRLWPGDPPATQQYDPSDKRIHRKNDTRMIGIADIRMPSMEVYLPAGTAAPTAAVILCPGGGYAWESVIDEGTQVAAKLNGQGIAAFVLRYRLPDGHAPLAGELPAPQQDVLRAVQIVRGRAAEWKIDPARVGVMGFSAGGHLAATAATMYDQTPSIAEKAKNDALSQVSARPDFVVLIYPVITMDKTNTHTGSRKNLIGDHPETAVEDRFSAEKHVTPQTPPLYLVVAEDDKTVPAVNSHLMAEAAEKAGVPHALLDLKTGGHGFGLGKEGTETGTWFEACMTWLKGQKLIAGA